MAYIVRNQNLQKFLPKMVPMTPAQVYLNQVSGAIETLRTARDGQSYIPAQLGGISGQRKVLQEAVVLQLTTFEIK